ncbi:hypothetical protein [Lewinella sp. W8]|uniref:hypothetical protein n=1 Tax=Lewinella sp. W8 TaxID=2528208 RepID=UPI00106867E4|nr:hypothetical protein [Lewinella sp. W8]MTB53083.1 hypothetical protein [Lewinella sp. W8]
MTRNKFTDVLHENAPKYLPEGVTLAELVEKPYTSEKWKMLAHLSLLGGYCFSPMLLCDCFGLPEYAFKKIECQRHLITNRKRG